MKPAPYILPVLFLLALYTRVLHWITLRASPLSDFLIGDEITHARWGEAVLSGDLASFLPFFRAPLYGFFLGGIWHLFPENLNAVRCAQGFLGLATGYLIYKTGCLVFNRRCAILAAAGFLFYPLQIYYENQLLLDTWFTFFCVAHAYLLLSARETGSPTWFAASGLCAGLAALVRPNILIWMPFSLLWVQAPPGSGNRARPVLLYLTAFVLSLLPSALMNTHIGNDRVLIATQGGINFWAGNHRKADGLIPIAPVISMDPTKWYAREAALKNSPWNTDNMWQSSRIIAEAETGATMTDGQVSRFWYRKAWQDILENPSGTLGRLIRKSLYLVGSIEVPNNTDPRYAMNAYFPYLKGLYKFWNFGVLWVLFLPGAWLAFHRFPKSRPLLGMLLALSASLVLYFVNARFRLPLIPFFILFAAVTLDPLGSLKDFKNYRSGAWLPVMGLLLAALTLGQAFRMYPPSPAVKAMQALFHHALARAEIQAGSLDRAREELRRAIQMDTGEAFIFYLTLAGIQEQFEDNMEDAIRSLEQSVMLKEHPVSLKALAAAYEKTGRLDQAAKVRDYLETHYPRLKASSTSSRLHAR